MGRVAKPNPFQLRYYLERSNRWPENGVGVEATQRMYDRRSGNFKAIGWVMTVYRGDQTQYETSILDTELTEFVQSNLPDFAR